MITPSFFYKPFKTEASNYTFYGAVFGITFPLVATFIATFISYDQLTIANIITSQITNPLLWIIDTAPFWLGLFARFAGRKQDRLHKIIAERDNTIFEQTKEIRKALFDAERASEVKSDFLANMSHEIRTPMNGIMGMNRLMLETSLDKEQQEYSESIKTSADCLLDLINDILDFSKIEAGKLELEIVDFDIVELIETTTDLLAPKANEKNLELLIDIDTSIPRCIKGDPSRIRQILINFIGNAIKFTEKGEIVVRIRKAPQTNGHDNSKLIINFSVVDTGIGIAKNKVQDIFESFTQADNSTTRKYGGTGLGLTISRQLTEIMQGKIGVESEPGQGSEFWFSIPLEFADKPLKCGHFADDSRVNFSNLRVLVVDDNETNRIIVRKNLVKYGCEILEADSGESALVFLKESFDQKNPIKIILMDMMMPGMDGKETVSEIRKTHSNNDVGIIMISSMGERISNEELESIGIDAYLHKPLKVDQLLSAMADFLSNKQKQIALEDDLTPILELKKEIYKGTRILVAEDNIINQKVIQRLLEKNGFKVDIAANGLEAVEANKRMRYDLILMDILMPELDGFQATLEIREIEKQNGCHIPIIALTANAIKGFDEKCIAGGMDGYISKPVHLESLLKKIDEIIQSDHQEVQSGLL